MEWLNSMLTKRKGIRKRETRNGQSDYGLGWREMYGLFNMIVEQEQGKGFIPRF